MNDKSPPTTARTIAQGIINVLCLTGLYAAAWTGRLGWAWFLGAVGLSMAWITPALLIQGFQMYARALHAPPPSTLPPSSGGGGFDGGDRGSRSSIAPPPDLPPGVFGFIELARGVSLRPALGATLAIALLFMPGCSGSSSPGLHGVLDGIWKVVTATCTGVRVASPLVDDLIRARPDASASSEPLDGGSP